MTSQKTAEYVLDFALKNDFGDVYPFVVFLGSLSSPEDFKNRLLRNPKLLQVIIKSVFVNSGVFEHLAIQEIEAYYSENPSMLGSNIQIPELSDFVKKFNAGGSQAAPVEYVLDFAVRNLSGNVWPGVAILGPLSSPADFMEALEANNDLREIIKRSLGKNASGGFDHAEIQERKKYFEQHPEKRFNTQNIPELAAFVKAFNSGGLQTAPADSLLVCTDPVPADLAAALADSIPSVKWEFAEIQGSVRDSKRETPLNLTKKANEILERVDEKLGRLVEVNEQTAQNTAKMARNTGTIAENTKRVSRETVERIEKMNGKDYRRFWQAEIQVPSMSYEEIWEWENPGRTLEGLDAEEKKQELTPIYTSLSRAKKEMERKKRKR